MSYYDNRVILGNNVRMDKGVVFTPFSLNLTLKDGRRRRLESKARLIIEDDVDIGANCVLNYGAEKDTIIHKGVYIGHLSSIGHDTEIGEYTVLSAHVCICGEVKIGEWCYIAPQTVVKPRVTIGDYTMIGMGSVVDKDIPSGVIAYGSPCKVVRKNKWRPPK